jgi:transcriptional regulator with XRE-family HTH domain
MMMNNQHYLRAWRHKRHLTQEMLGDMVGKVKQTILRYESGYSEIPLGVLGKLAVALDTSRANILDNPPD